MLKSFNFPLMSLTGMFILLVAVSQAQAVFVTDYFDYGGSTVDLHNLGTATDGWTGAWTRRDTSTSLLGPDYAAGDRLVFGNPDYSNDLNPVGSGGATIDTGNAVHPSQRTLTPTGEGDVWISVLARLSNVEAGFNSRATVWLNPGASLGGTADGVRFGIQDNLAIARMGSNTTQDEVEVTLNNNETYLWLARLTVDGSGDDNLDFWIKSASDDISSVTALGSPVASITGLNYFGASGLTEVGLGFHNDGDPSTLDALRISNEANAFQQVTLGFTPVVPVPEPGSLLGLSLGSVLLLLRRRKSRR